MSDEHREGSVEAIVAGALTSPGLDDLAADYTQLGLDAIIDGDTLLELPVAKSVVAVVRMGVGIRNRLFARKLLDFLAGFRGVTEWERQDMVSRLEADPAYGRRVGEHLTELLDRIESAKKPKMVARVFRAYADKSIDAAMLHRLNFTIERLPVYAIAEVASFATRDPRKRADLSVTTLLDFVNSGLASIGSPLGGLSYLPTDVCMAFVRLDLDK
jgi:hypothetical protein